MFKPFRFFGQERAPSNGFYHIRNFVRDIPVDAGLEEIEFDFTPVEMKAMYRPSLALEVYDVDDEIEITSIGVLGSKLLVRLQRRTGKIAHIKAVWEERYLYDS